MQVEESSTTDKEGECSDGGRKRNDSSITIDSTDDENCNEFRTSGRFAKRNYRKRSNSSGSSSPMQPDYGAVLPASITNTNQNAERGAGGVAEHAAADSHSSDSEHSQSVIGMYGMTTDSNSSSSSSTSTVSGDTSGDEMMSEECTSDSNVSEETENKSARVLNRPTPK